MPDMLVKLYELPPIEPVMEVMAHEGIEIRRAMAPDKSRILEWIKLNSSVTASSEADVCFSRIPISLFLATRGKEIVGYACYNATAPDFFGPTRVLDSEQGKQVGKALLLRCLYNMKEEGYGYAIIGGVGPQEFYRKCVNAILIEGSKPGLYKDYLGARE